MPVILRVCDVAAVPFWENDLKSSRRGTERFSQPERNCSFENH
jgi:hypothetical protein